MEKEEIREIRGNLTQAAFARKLGVTVQEVSNWETGRCKPRRKNVIKIMLYLKYQERLKKGE